MEVLAVVYNCEASRSILYSLIVCLNIASDWLVALTGHTQTGGPQEKPASLSQCPNY